jgi:hypothetical protein
MAESYRYIRAGRRYVCLEQGPLSFAGSLLDPDGGRHARPGGRARGWRARARQVLEPLGAYLFGPRERSRVLELPVRGNDCRRVQRGYKVFDRRRRRVIKVFRPDVEPAVVGAEIEAVSRAARLDFAVRLERSSFEERWYEEELARGPIGHQVQHPGRSGYSEFVAGHVLPCLAQMALLEPPRFVDLEAYVAGIAAAVEAAILGQSAVEPGRTEGILKYVESLSAEILSRAAGEVALVFSHGDFSLANMILEGRRVKVIDWEGAGPRSVLYDLLTFFSFEVFYDRAGRSLVPELRRATGMLTAFLEERAPELMARLGTPFALRRLFYLERIRMLLERELDEGQLDVVRRSIDVFKRHEADEEEARAEAERTAGSGSFSLLVLLSELFPGISELSALA